MISDALLDVLLEFRRERDWEQFHTIRNLCAALCVESAELLDHFRWARDSEQNNIIEKQRAEIEDELADVTILLSYIFHDLGISVEDVVKKNWIRIEENTQLRKQEVLRLSITSWNRHDPVSLTFDGCDCFEAMTVFAGQFGRGIDGNSVRTADTIEGKI